MTHVRERWLIVRTPLEWQISDGYPGDRSTSFDFPIDTPLDKALYSVTYQRRKQLGDDGAEITFEMEDDRDG